MVNQQKHDLALSRWPAGPARLLDVVCLLVLVLVIAAVIYGFALRAIWAHGYYIALALAVVGALVLMIGLAQQAIAARDAATWRDMAVWQLHAARTKVLAGRVTAAGEGVVSADDPAYYEHLVEVMLDSVSRGDDGEA
jgi:hypothetical protein